MTIFTSENIVWMTVLILSIGAIIGIYLKRKKRLSAEQEAKHAEKILTEDETKLKELFEKKKKSIHDIRQSLQEKSFYGVKTKSDAVMITIKKQQKLLKEITSIEQSVLAHLKHINVEVKSKSDRVHVSEFVGEIEKKIGNIDDDAVRKQIITRIQQETDELNKDVLVLAFSLSFIYLQFKKITNNLEKKAGQKTDVKKSQVDLVGSIIGRAAGLINTRPKQDAVEESTKSIVDFLTSLESRVAAEGSELEVIFTNLVSLRKNIKKLHDKVSEINAEKGPRFTIKGHPVEIVTNIESRKTVSKGQGDGILLGSLSTYNLIGHNAEKCQIVLGSDCAQVQGMLSKQEKNFILSTVPNTPGLFVLRPSKGILVIYHDENDKRRLKGLLFNDAKYKKINELFRQSQKRENDRFVKDIKLKSGDIIMTINGYELEFSDSL